MKRLAQLTASIMLACSPLVLHAAEVATTSLASPKIGVVSVRACVDQSKEGHRARDNLENVNKQMSKNLEELSKQIEEVSAKLNDEDSHDSLTPDAEKTLQERLDALMQEHDLKRMQFGQQMNQAQMAAMQQLFDHVSRASESVAGDMGLDLILQEDSSFYFNPKLDITERVIESMNKFFDEAQKAQASVEAAKKEEAAAPKKEEPAKKEQSPKK